MQRRRCWRVLFRSVVRRELFRFDLRAAGCACRTKTSPECVSQRRQSILTCRSFSSAFDSRLSNGRAEGISSLIQPAKARARSHRTSCNLITMAYLIAGKLVHFPAGPFRRAAKPSPAVPSPT
jgi:hypothetical protein